MGPRSEWLTHNNRVRGGPRSEWLTHNNRVRGGPVDELELAHLAYASTVPVWCRVGLPRPGMYRPMGRPMSAPSGADGPKSSRPMSAPATKSEEKKQKDEYQAMRTSQAAPPGLPPRLTSRRIDHFGCSVISQQSTRRIRRGPAPAPKMVEAPPPPQRKAYHPDRRGCDPITSDDRQRNAWKFLRKERDEREQDIHASRQRALHRRTTALDFAREAREDASIFRANPSSSRVSRSPPPRPPFGGSHHRRHLSPSAQRHHRQIVVPRQKLRYDRRLSDGHPPSRPSTSPRPSTSSSPRPSTSSSPRPSTITTTTDVPATLPAAPTTADPPVT